VLDELGTSGHVGGRVHGVDGAALWVDVRELWKGAVGEVGEEVVSSDKLVHVVVLNPFVLPSVEDVGLVVVLPADAGVVHGLEDGSSASGSGNVGEPARSLVGVVDHTAGGTRGSELTVWVGWTRVLSVVGVEETEALGKSGKGLRGLLAVGLDDERSITWSLAVLLGLTLDETTHVWGVVLAWGPLLVDLVAGACEVVVWVLERDFVLVWTGTDGDWLVVDGPVWVGVVVAVVDVAQVVNVVVEVPVSGDVVEAVVLHHQVNDVLDVVTDVGPLGTGTGSAGVTSLSWVELLGWQGRSSGDQAGGGEDRLHCGCE